MHKSTKIVKRMIFADLIAHLDVKEAMILLGPRQVGKTTLMREMQKYLVENKKILPKNIFFFNLDILSDREIFQSQSDFINFLRERSRNDFIYVFIDEAQRIPQSGIFIKGIYDLELPVKFILSGSSSLEIKNKMQETLTGRKKVFAILPFSFEEFLDWKEDKFKEIIFQSTALTAEELFKANDYLNEYIAYGGYPRIVIEKDEEKKKELLEEIYSSYIEKDIIGFLKIDNSLAFSGLVKFLALQNGQLANMHQISKSLNLNQRTTEKYVGYLEQTFVIRKLSPFFSNAQKEMVKMPKIYFLDTGIKSLIASDFSKFKNRSDGGALLENFVFNEIKRKLKMAERTNFWRNKTGAEVDFIIRKGVEIIPMEVKTKNEDLKIEKSLRSFCGDYKIAKGYVIFGEGQTGKNDALNIHFLPAYKIPSIAL